VRGRVQYFIPSARKGIVQAENGLILRFSVIGNTPELQGGDIVEFDITHNSHPHAINVTLKHRWSEVLNDQHRSLVNQFHNMINIVS